MGQQQTEEKKSEGQQNEITVSRQPWKRINIRSIPHKGAPLATSQKGPVGFSKWDAITPAHRQPFQNLQLFKNSSHILSPPPTLSPLPSFLPTYLPSPNSPINKGEAWQDYCLVVGAYGRGVQVWVRAHMQTPKEYTKCPVLLLFLISLRQGLSSNPQLLVLFLFLG